MQNPMSPSQIRRKRAARKTPGFLGRAIRLCFWSSLVLVLAAAAAAVGLYFYLNEDLPSTAALKNYRPPAITTVYSDDNRRIAEFYKERRIILPLADIPQTLIDAFVAAEDARFFTHQGIDLVSIIRAFFKNLEAGAIVQGGSTITQQVTKSFLLTPERSYTRKLKEAILAYRIDRSFSKEEILHLYLNQIYLGHGAYGVAAAAENYFGKAVDELNLAECAVLAGLPQAPSRYSPFKYPEKAKQRQIYVLNRMVEEGKITNLQATDAINAPLDIKPRRNWYIEEVPFFTEHVRRYLEQTYGAEALYTGGLKVYTTVNIDMQKAAREEVLKGLAELDKRQGYRGPERRLAPGEIEAFSLEVQKSFEEEPSAVDRVVSGVVIGVDDKAGKVTVRMGSSIGVIKLADMRWARKPNPDVPPQADRLRRPGDALASGDVVRVRLLAKPDTSDTWDLALEQTPEAEGALLCLETGTGHVKAMIGGRDFRRSQFNRAVQSRRQPGSAFKPIIYAAAIDKGYTPATMVIDSPVVTGGGKGGGAWKPKNYQDTFHGPTLLREALAKSRNVITVKILQDIGIDYAIEYARKLGITSPISRDLTIALGSSGVSLLELTTAYSVFANEGYLVEPVFITRILDRDGKVLEETQPRREKVVEKSTAYIMTSLMESVIKSGTGARVRALNRPAAGKTGTTNDLFDTWFIGYTPRYVTGTWVGFDEEKSLGHSENGALTASPIWLGFMRRVLEGKPVRVFNVPEGVVFAKIDAETGLLPIPESKNTIFECFKEGSAPTEQSKRPNVISDKEDFYKTEM